MSTREEILNRIRETATAGKNPDTRQAAVARRIRLHPAGLKPFKEKDAEKCVKLFIKKAIAADATATKCKPEDVAKNISLFLRNHNLPPKVRIGTDRKLKNFLSSGEKYLDVSVGPSDGNDLACVSCALSAAAETGTLVLDSGPQNPTTLNFLSENHIVVIREADILLHQEDVWKKIRKKYGAGKVPRTLNMITGPSRSADIEQTLILGAHGPLRLHILVVGE